MSTEIKLLPCLFCGGEASMEDWEDQNTDMDFSVGCKDAGCMGHETFGGNYGTPEQAAAAWNRRTPQTVAVIAPAIEWGKRKGFLIQSKCGWYDLRFMTEGEGWQAWSNDDRAFSPLTKLATSEIEAKAACQAHLQAQVNAALEGCNMRPWVDPQGLVDAIKTARPKIIKLLQ